MDWLMIFVVMGAFSGDVKTEHVTEAQCKAILAEEVAMRRYDRVTCVSPDGEFLRPVAPKAAE